MLWISYDLTTNPDTFALDISDYPNTTQATSLWNWIKAQVPLANGEEYDFIVTTLDCAGNQTSGQFKVCIDLQNPGNTISFFDARPADAGVWLAWQWTPGTQAVEMGNLAQPVVI